MSKLSDRRFSFLRRILSVRLILAMFGDKRSGIGHAAVRGHPPVLTGADLVAQIVISLGSSLHN